MQVTRHLSCAGGCRAAVTGQEHMLLFKSGRRLLRKVETEK
jgi:hypothetical protein